MNNPFDYLPDAACEEAFEKLVDRIETLKKSCRAEDINFCREIEAGKMLGVLIAADDEGLHHTLYAFSGQLGNGGFHYPGFVEPVFDYLQPNGYFKIKEAEISRQNDAIKEFENGLLSKCLRDWQQAKEQLDAEIKEYKDKCLLSKLERNAKRDSGIMDEEERAAMIRQSQFEKAELRRLKKRAAARLEPFESGLTEAQAHLESMKEKRRSESETLQQWLFSGFRLLNARGESRNLIEIFSATSLKVPPSGAGECCAPKLLQGAYLRGWHPVSIAEYWYGKPKGGEVRRHGEHYPACRGKCLPVLTWMLQGLNVEPPLEKTGQMVSCREPEIVFENQWFCVVNKPAGMLSVPGKGEIISLQQWLIEKYGAERKVKMAHRLDQDTSGLIVATFGEESFKIMQALFAIRKVKKTYIAELEGDYESRNVPRHGRIGVPLLPDWLDRPRQRVDFDQGKEALTDYEFIGRSENRSRILFRPLTGRTHQLRVHAASESGLGMPIVGDRLYGDKTGSCSERLLLHAHKIEFRFPLDGILYSFESPVPF
ncbi:MAG: RNA pseudouridine synthase [Muribaculaceae bacterium]|nr:RNA pseudouridine synthase [Muribaculaceae bacterium]